jgi:MFS family permease
VVQTAGMQPAGARLSIDYGTATTVAVLALPGGGSVPVLVEGMPAVPSGVYVDPEGGHLVAGGRGQSLAMSRPDCHVLDPKQHLTAGKIHIAGHHIDVLDMVAATLRLVADEAARIAAGPAAEVAVTVPAGWGPRRRGLLRQAVTRAGLIEPHLIADPIAAAAELHHTGPSSAACLLVCDAGAATMQISVVQREPDGWQILATHSVPNAGGHHIDDLIVAHTLDTLAGTDPDMARRLREPAGPDDARDQYALREAARQAKHALWQAPSTLIALPAPHPSMAIDHGQLATLLTPLLAQLGSTIDNVMDAPGVVANQITAVVLTGGDARLPGLAEAVAVHTGLAPVVPQRPDQALADGVRHVIADASAAGPSAPTDAPPRVRLGIRQTVAPLALFAASLAVLIQTLSAADTYRQVAQTQVVANSAGFSIAALCAMLAALAAAHMVTTAGAVVDAAEPVPPPARWSARLVAKSYAGAAAIGIIIAAIYGLLAGAYFGLADNPYLRWSLLSALPVAAIAAATALLAARLPGRMLPDWLRQVRQPVYPVILAALGVLAMWAALTVSPSAVPFLNLIGRAGAAAVGVATALTVTREPRLRALVGTILALGAATVFTLTNNTLIDVAYIVAVTWWWLVQLVSTTRRAAPHVLPAVSGWIRGAR